MPGKGKRVWKPYSYIVNVLYDVTNKNDQNQVAGRRKKSTYIANAAGTALRMASSSRVR